MKCLFVIVYKRIIFKYFLFILKKMYSKLFHKIQLKSRCLVIYLKYSKYCFSNFIYSKTDSKLVE